MTYFIYGLIIAVVVILLYEYTPLRPLVAPIINFLDAVISFFKKAWSED